MQTLLPTATAPSRSSSSAHRGPPAAAAPGWLGLFANPPLNPVEQRALLALAQPRTVPAGTMVLDRRELAHALVLVDRGDVALGYRGADGVFHIERPLRGPAWVDQSSAWLRETHAMDARASSEVVLVELPCEALRAQIERHPGLAGHLVTGLAREVRGLSMNTHELMHKDAPARFAAWLAQRLEGSGDGAMQVRLGERKRDIASQLAITPETLSRLMRSLAQQGVIAVSGYTVQVLDSAALLRAASPA